MEKLVAEKEIKEWQTCRKVEKATNDIKMKEAAKKIQGRFLMPAKIINKWDRRRSGSMEKDRKLKSELKEWVGKVGVWKR